MDELLYEIKNLECAYDSRTPVLNVPELNIPRGKLIFIIGRSGIGKSTFIETIGLMNNTISRRNRNTQVLFYDNHNGSSVNIADIWTNEIGKLSSFRQKHFSFIFQNTNLMPNFSAGQNMMMTLLIKGCSYHESKKQVEQMMERIDLPLQIFNNHISSLSGGQRQRLAFVRAITADFSVLFGDEPTGNLDRSTSEELISILKFQLKTEIKRTAVIVSHDLNLALNFADQIIPIFTTYNEKGDIIGNINQSNIINRDVHGWKNFSGVQINDAQNYLNSFIKR